MTKLQEIIRKKCRVVVGLLSGTSVDAVDVVLTTIKGNGTKTNINVLGYTEFEIPAKLKYYILKVSNVKTGNVEDVTRLNVILGRFYAKCVIDSMKIFNFNLDDVDLIGSHGQTIHHLPKKLKLFGFDSSSTLQIGDPSIIAALTGVTTIGDFRIADVGVGGSGAPLVPYLDYITFSDNKKSRILINIGGISNITVLNAGAGIDEVYAFDTGPGNMMIDYISQKLFAENFDRDSYFASKGKTNKKLLSTILKSDKFYNLKPPKSTGRELYNDKFVEKILKEFSKLNKYDIIRTFTEYTAFTIAYNIKMFTGKLTNYEILVSGGGAYNRILIDALKHYLNKSEIVLLSKNGINVNNKEAVLFAVLANECLSAIPANLMRCTGSKKKSILGKICQVL